MLTLQTPDSRVHYLDYFLSAFELFHKYATILDGKKFP